MTTLKTVKTKRPQVDQERSTRETCRQVSSETIIPSFNAALLLVIPSILLNWSSIALLVGIGIYYGIVYTENLGALRGDNSNLAILLVYVLFTIGAILSYILPWWQKALESTAHVQSDFKRFFSNERRDSLQGAKGPEPITPDQDDQTGIKADLELQKLSRKHTSKPHPPTHHCSPRIQVDAWASTQPQATGPDFLPTSWRDPSIESRMPLGHITVNSWPIMSALSASISAQRASLQAQEILLQRFQEEEYSRSLSSRRRSL